jgi:hypothetical protein
LQAEEIIMCPERDTEETRIIGNILFLEINGKSTHVY